MTKKIGNFRITKSVEIDEIQSRLVELVHEPTGAQVMQIANEDEENLFNLSFRTWPDTSNGVAHVLEHTVLCGSKKFPVRDPFFSMTRRSLNTFMNALTGADFTCYPAASQVPQDFYNLLDVYLDAVFHPKIDRLSFLQEGHRLEFMEPTNPNSPLIFKGIVFNEMKGAMATGEARMNEELMHALYPDITYGVNSGGDPKVIPDLTYDDLKQFHATFYHPSRCLFFFYGNLPLEQHLATIEEKALKNVEKLADLPPLSKQKRFTKKVSLNKSYPIAEEENAEDKTLVGLGWLTCSILEQEELLALNVLDLVLMGTDAAPLKMALLKSNLCKQTDSLIDNDLSEIPYILLCKGCSEGAPEKIEAVVQETLQAIVKKGLPQHLIEGAIHQLEMSRKEITGNSSPYGLAIYFRSALLKQHGGNAEDGLRIHSLFKKLRENVAKPGYLTSLIEKHFLKNPHCVRIALHPDKKLEVEEVEKEQEKLIELCDQLQDRDVKAILDQSKQLKKLQEEDQEEDVDILPQVTLADVSSQGREFLLNQSSLDQFTLYHHPCFTNDILYADLVFDLPMIGEKELPYLRLFSLFLPQVGCGGRSYQDNLEYLLQHTGGVGTALDLCLQADNSSNMRPALSVRGKSLYSKQEKLFPIFYELLTSADFTDVPRLTELLMQHFNGLESSIQQSPLRYAVNLASSGLSIPSKIGNSWYGLDYYWAMKEIVAAFKKNPDSLIVPLQSLQTRCLGLEGGDLILSCDQATCDQLQKAHFYGLSEMATKSEEKWQPDYPLSHTQSQGRITSSPVAFTATLFPSVSFTHPDAAALSISSEIMENKTLHKRIREQGGAYGSGAVNGVLSGQFYFYAYRDPHLAATLDAFHEAVEEIAAGHFDERAIEEAKLGLFQELDSPIPPGSRAITNYSRMRGGRSPKRRQEFRNRLLSATAKQVQEATNKHLIPGLKKSVTVTFAGKELLDKENSHIKPQPLPLYTVDDHD